MEMPKSLMIMFLDLGEEDGVMEIIYYSEEKEKYFRGTDEDGYQVLSEDKLERLHAQYRSPRWIPHEFTAEQKKFLTSL